MFNVVVGSFLGNLNVCVRGGHCDFFLFCFCFCFGTLHLEMRFLLPESVCSLKKL